MVHCFSFDNDYYLYDVASGSLHKCDALTCQVINKMQGLPYDFAGVDSSVTDEIEKEINELKEQGLLMQEDNKVAPPKSEFVKALCLHICHDCNLRCKYCFAGTGDYKGNREFMSEEVALKMAYGVSIKAKAEVGVGISGIAGPTGATENKPIGMVCFGFYINGMSYSVTKFFGDIGRNNVRNLSVAFVLDFLNSVL